MDWAEEFKMNFRKTTARKGRRSKSRDVPKDTQSNTTGSSDPSVKKEIEIDITLDMQNTTSNISSTTATPPSSSTTPLDTDTKRPHFRRISGGWADTSFLKSSKSKKGSFEDDRFQFNESKLPTNSISEDDIPVVPDMDDIKDDIILNEVVDPPPVTSNPIVAISELHSDLLSQKTFSALQDVDLSILTRCLQPPNTLDEADDVWEWDKLFTEIVTLVNSENVKSSKIISTEQKIEIGPDELPPMPHDQQH